MKAMQDHLASKFPSGGGNDEYVQKDEFIFQQARTVMIATYQHILYKEYLPKVLGPEMYGSYKFGSDDTDYDIDQDPTITNEFATFAYRCRNQYLDLICRLGSATPWSPPSSRG